MDNCIFCKIVAGTLPCEKIIETVSYMAFKDANPKAPVHVLIVPKRHVERPEELSASEIHDMIVGSEEVAQIKGIKETGYRLLFNVGKHAGQSVDHVHLHILGGSPATGLY